VLVTAQAERDAAPGRVVARDRDEENHPVLLKNMNGFLIDLD
jgi:hypothetical protein